MLINEIHERPEPLIRRLTDLWERSVRASHHFLSDAEIQTIRPCVPEALKSVGILLTAETTDGAPAAFLGMENRRIEMLFVDSSQFRQGIGRALVMLAVTHFGADSVTVNEQNPQALAFYERQGFVVEKRTPTDEAGRPYPLLYLRLVPSAV